MTTQRVVIEVSERGARVVKRNLEEIGTSSEKASKGVFDLKSALAGLGLSFSILQVVNLADSYTSLINRLKLVTTSTENLVAVNKALFDISNKTLSSYSATITLYSRFAVATERLGVSQSRLLGITKSINLASVLSGTTAQNQEAGLRQLAQGIASNVLRGDELTSILENLPKVASVIAEGMGATVGDLKTLGEQGKITALDIVKAFEKAAPDLEAEFGKITLTVGNSLTVLQNNLLRFVGELDQGAGVTGLLAQGILGLANNMDILLRSLIAVSIVLATQYAVQGVGAAVAATRALTIAIAANPLGAIVKGVLVASAALAAFSDTIMVTEESTTTLADVGVEAFKSLASGISSVVTFISTKFPEIGPIFDSAFGNVDLSVKSMMLSVARGVDTILGAFRGLGSAIPLTFSGLGRVIELIFNNIFNAVLRSAAAWLNLLIDQINSVGNKIGISLIDRVTAFQIPLTSKSEQLGKDISSSIAKGIQEENSAQKVVEDILDRADLRAKNRANAPKGIIGDIGGSGLSGSNSGLSSAEKESQKFIKALLEEEIQIGKTKSALALLKAEELGVLDKARPIIESIENKTRALDAQKEATEKLKQDMESVRRITDQMLTPQEKLNKEIAEFNRLLSLPDGKGLTIETYNRALKDAQDEFDKTQKAGKSAFGSLDQYAVQAARNIQTSLANFLFDPFQDGLDGMVKGVLNAVRRMVAEFAALKISQSLGLSELFGLAGSGSASQSTGSGSILNLASSALNLFSTGSKGIGSIIGKGLGSIGIGGGFSSGLSGSSSAGVFGAGGRAFLGGSGTALGGTAASEFGMAATLGSGFAAAAGPLMATAIATGVLKALAGDKRLGGGFGKALNTIGDLPIIGDLLPIVPLLNGLFGHGPLKFRQEVVTGNANAQGFGGNVTDVFRAKGGLFVGNKHKEQASPREAQLVELIDSSIKGFADSTRAFAQNLGADTSTVENFSRVIRLESVKKERITQEAVQGLLDSISEELAGGIVSKLGILAKTGENNVQALTRVNAEFNALNLVALATGRSLKEARDAVLSLPVALRTQVIDQLGGVDAANEKISFFISNFLTSGEKLKPLFESLDERMRALGFSANISREEFKKLIQSIGTLGGISQDQAVGLFNLQKEFLQVKDLMDETAGATNNVVTAEQDLSNIRSQLISQYQKETGELQNTIDKFQNLAAKIKDFREGLLFSELSPLTPGQKLSEARNQFNQTRALAAKGDENALAKLPDVAQEFLKASQTYNASSGAFISDFNLVQDVLKSAESVAKGQGDIAKEQLDTMKTQVGNLVDINENTSSLVDLVKQLMTAVLGGSGNSNISTQQIQDFLKANPNLTPQEIGSIATKNGVSIGQLQNAGVNTAPINQFLNGKTVTDKQIVDFVNSGATPRQIYDAAKANGVTFSRLSKVTGITIQNMEQWARSNNLPVLDRGTDFVSRSGIGMLHAGEAVTPSSLPDKIDSLVNEIKTLREEQKEQTAQIVRITAVTNSKNAETIVKGGADNVDKQVWKQRNGTRRK